MNVQQLIQFMKCVNATGDNLVLLAQGRSAPGVTGSVAWTIVNIEGSFTSPHLDATAPAPDFDGYAHFEDAGAAAMAAAELASRGVATQTFEVECFETPWDDLQHGGGILEAGFVKRVAVVSRRPDLDRNAFADYYEHHHAPLAARLMPSIARYRRTFLGALVGDAADGWAQLEFDAVTELYYRSESDRQRFRDALSDREVARRIAEDEANFLDRSAIHGLDVSEVELRA